MSAICFRRILLLAALSLGVNASLADSWAPPSTEVTASGNGRFRVTVVPRGIKSPLAFFEDKADGKVPAGQRENDAQASPIARVEHRATAGTWRLLWQKPLLNDVGPTDVLLADDGSFLVTFDNWHSVGFGDDVVVIYDRHGNLVRKLSLEQILPAAYVIQLPRSVSSRWWGGKHRLVESGQVVELQIVEPGADRGGKPKYVPVRIRLADGVVVPPSGDAWKRALTIANALEAKRVAAWQKVREERVSLLAAPSTADTHAWRHYMFEIRDRVGREDESSGGMVLAAPGADPGFHDEEAIVRVVDDYDVDTKYQTKLWFFSSPTSDRLANILSRALRARRPGSMRGAHITFIGTLAEGRMVAEQAQKAGAKVTVIDRTQLFPPGKPLPETPPPLWVDMSDTF